MYEFMDYGVSTVKENFYIVLLKIKSRSIGKLFTRLYRNNKNSQSKK